MKSKAILISILAIISLTSCGDFIENALTDEMYTDTIQQWIGGELLRTLHYHDTFHSWDYDIQYTYKNESENVYAIGKGNYHGQELPKDEQFIQSEHWMILKISKSREADVLFIGKAKSTSWIEYEIAPKIIEQEALWKKQQIIFRLDNWDLVSKIQKIEANGYFSGLYTFEGNKNSFF